MDDLTVSLQVSVNVKATKNGDLGNAVSSPTFNHNESIKFGTGSSLANTEWTDSRTLAATSESLDMSGTLVNEFGETLTLSKIKGIIIENLATTAGYVLKVGGAASNALLGIVADATDKIQIGPGGVLVLTSPVDGFTVTGATGDLLKIDAGSNAINYKILIWGN